jgi:hypothetical protein
VDAVAAEAATSAVVWVRPGPPHAIDGLRAVPPLPVAGERFRVVARLTDRFGNAAEGDRVEWIVEGGTAQPDVTFAEAGRAETFVAPRAGSAEVAVEARSGEAHTRAVFALASAPPRAHLAWLPAAWRASAGGCENVLSNPSFEADTDGDQLPDDWSVEGAGVQLLDLGLDGRRSIRLRSEPGQTTGRIFQDLEPPAGGVAVLRLWLRGSGSLRASVWSMVQVGDRRVRAPVVLELLDASTDWELHVLPLPQMPSGPTTVELSRRGGDLDVMEVDRVALEICP